jgi:RNA polymerase sigma factor (sigma-70 family)
MELCGKGVTFFPGLLFNNGNNATMDDWQLLKDYAAKNSQEAFRALVQRYSGMVYHAALRQTGNPHAAEEVAQVVFIALAQKADRIPRQPTLYGWLFRATRFAVLNQARQSANRERHEQETVAMQPITEPNEADSTWERLTPHLNDALDKLSAGDRELLMIRYFGNKSHKEVAEALGVSEETARKRLSRAMERLREIFARRGVVVSSLALAAAFAAHGAKAAPMEAASSWAEVAMAKAAAGTAAGSAGGIVAFVTSAKVAGLVAALVLGGTTFAIYKSISRGSPAPLATNLAISQGAPDTNGSLTGPSAPSRPAGDAVVSAAALDKVRAALHDPNPTTWYPNSVMQEAIAGLGDKKKAALPILEAALHEADADVRLRAVDGLGIIGPEAGAAAPLLLAMLRDGGLGKDIPRPRYPLYNFTESSPGRPWTIYPDNIILYVLGQIGPAPEVLPEFARLMKENRSVSAIVYQATRQFFGVRRSMQAGGWLWAIANEDSKALNNAFRPLLQDTDKAVRCTAALSLVSALGDQADAGVFPVAADMLKTRNIIGEQDGLWLLQSAALDPGPDSAGVKFTLNAPRLGPYLNETVSALADAAYHGATENVRLGASKMLDVLVPDLRQSNPSLAAVVEQQRQADAFTAKVTSGEATTPEIVEGLKKFPKAAPDIAFFSALNGSHPVELLPAFTEALAALAPAPDAGRAERSDASSVERSRAINTRMRLANAMQKIAPELPKPIFTVNDVIALGRIMQDPAVQADPDRFQKVSAAWELAKWPDRKSVGIFFDVSPDEMRRLLAAMKEADAPTYDALVVKVKEIDPHFFPNH